MTTAKTPKGRIVQIGEPYDGTVTSSGAPAGTYIETPLMFGGVRVASFGYYSRQQLPSALICADDFIDQTGLSTT